MSYNPDTGFFYVPGTVRTSAFARYGDTYKKGKQYNGGTQAAPIISANERRLDRGRRQYQYNRLAEKDAVPRRQRRRLKKTRRLAASFFTVIRGGTIQARVAKTGELLWLILDPVLARRQLLWFTRSTGPVRFGRSRWQSGGRQRQW